MHRVSKKSNSRRHQSHIMDPIGHDQGLGILLSQKGKIQRGGSAGKGTYHQG